MKTCDVKDLSRLIARWPPHKLAGERWFPQSEEVPDSWNIIDYSNVDGNGIILILAKLKGLGLFFLPVVLESETLKDAVDNQDYHDMFNISPGERIIPGQKGIFKIYRTQQQVEVRKESHKSLCSSTNSCIFPLTGGFLKTFRRVSKGLHPEIQVLSAIDKRSHAPIPSLLGWMVYQDNLGQDYTLAIWEESLQSSGTAWEVISNKFNEGEDNWVIKEISRLGSAVSRLHTALITAFPVEKWVASEYRDWRYQILKQLESIKGLPNCWEMSLISQVESWMAGRPRPLKTGAKIKVHGDLHLEQILRVGQDWVIIDFEGEPLRTMEERGVLNSPLKDVATMLRSLEYLASELEQDQMLANWKRRFLESYLGACSPKLEKILPQPPAETLRLFLLERVIYEIDYEARYRPQRINVPIKGLKRLIKGGEIL